MILRGNYTSEILRSATNIQVFIPEKSAAPFRIVYLLHGLHGNHGSWGDNSMLVHYGKKYNVIFVMPDVGRSFYCDLEHGRKYFSLIADELPQICGKIFNISAKLEDTAVIGYSMGGFGALRLALSRPEQYSFCGAISPACLYFKPLLDTLRENPEPYLKTGAEAQEIYKDQLAIYGEGLKYKPEYDVLELVKNFPNDKPKPKMYVTCGTEDGLLKENHKFREEMKNTNFDYTYEEWTGGHDWEFFNDALRKTLEFWHKN